MDINSVNIDKNIQNVQSNNQSSQVKNELQSKQIDENAKSRSVGDSLEISEEAKKLQQIKQQVETGFYNQDSVIKQTAVMLDNDLQKDSVFE